MKPQPFIVEEEERLVMLDGTSQSGAKLVLCQRRPPDLPEFREVVVRVEALVTQIVVY